MKEVKNKLLKYCFECKEWVAFFVVEDKSSGKQVCKCVECSEEVK